MPYVNDTDRGKIEKQITKTHDAQQASLAVLDTIETLAARLVPASQDQRGQWIAALIGELGRGSAAAVGGSKDLIEIYPSGTRGVGRSDRIYLQVGGGHVEVVKAGLSEH